MNSEIIMLGTGNAMVTKCYNTCFALRCEERYMLVDAGGGNTILSQLEKAGVPYDKLEAMFVTHGHTDHVLGVIWIIRKIALLINTGKYEGVFNIYCHDEVAKILEVICGYTLGGKLTKHIGSLIKINVVEDGDCFEAAGMHFKAFDILSTKIKQFGFEADILGKKLICLGDEPYNSASNVNAYGADLLMSEAYCLYSDRERCRPYEKHHSTALDAGRIAESLKVKALLIYHTEDVNLDTRKTAYAAEAAQEFSGRIIVPDDLERINI